jgi:hypothetical protein
MSSLIEETDPNDTDEYEGLIKSKGLKSFEAFKTIQANFIDSVELRTLG